MSNRSKTNCSSGLSLAVAPYAKERGALPLVIVELYWGPPEVLLAHCIRYAHIPLAQTVPYVWRRLPLLLQAAASRTCPAQGGPRRYGEGHLPL